MRLHQIAAWLCWQARRPRRLRLLATSSPVPLVTLLVVVCWGCLLLITNTGEQKTSKRHSAQLELNAVAAALRLFSNSSDPANRRLADTARSSLERAGRLLGLTVLRNPPPSPLHDPALRVCPERYISSTVGYPFFYDGWRTDPCPLSRDYGRLLTVLLTLTEAEDVPRVRRVLAGLNERYPGVPALVAVTDDLTDRLASFRDVTAVPVQAAGLPPPLGALLNELVSRADTKYVLLAAELERLDSDAELERLLREAERQRAGAVAGAVRSLDGHWTHGCFQTRFSNYSLRYHAGYHHSEHECLQCDHLAGPLLARTELLRRWPLAERNALLAERWLLDVRSGGGWSALVCPDVMFHVRQPRDDTGAAWLEEARRLGVTRIEPPEGGRLEFSCEQLRLKCKKLPGRLLSPCCRQQLLRLIHGVMEGCQQAGALCELQEGTLLGAVKFGSILPWERDADITFSSARLGKLERLEAEWGRQGLRWVPDSQAFCCHDNRTSGGVAKAYHGQWVLELWGQHWLDTEKLRDQGLPPTRVQLDGRWYPAPRNPGLYVRNRYGREVYRHAEHWMTTGRANSWAAYTTTRFQPCRKPGHHSCLDQYLTDGVIQFEPDVWPLDQRP